MASPKGRGGWPVGLLLAGLVWLVGCDERSARQTLVVTLESTPSSLDPYHHNEIVGWSLLCNFYDALVRFTPDMRIEPALAVSWGQLDQTHVRFVLRPGVTFAGGEALTADDVVASYERAVRDPGSKIRHLLLGIRSVSAAPDGSVVVETATPAPTLVNRLALLFIVPRSIAGQAEIPRPNGTGPYRFIERTPDGAIVAEGWRSWRGLPEIRRVVFRLMDDEERRSREFLAGESDVAPRLADDMIGEVQRRPALRIRQQPKLVVQLLQIAPHAATGEVRRALADPRVRRALLLGLNREELVNRAFRGNGTVASQYVHPVVFGYDPTIMPLPYDPARARALLAQAGFEKGFVVDLGYGSVLSAYVAALADSLRRIGVVVRPQAMPLAELLRRARAGELPIFTIGRACTTGDASEFLDSSLHSPDEARSLGVENYSGYADSQTDELLDGANRELDSWRRLGLLQQAQRRVLESLPILPLTVRNEFVGFSRRVDVVLRFDAWIWVAGLHWDRS